MKNSKEYADKLKKTFQAWKRQSSKAELVTFADPIEALVVGILCQLYPDAEAKKIYKRMQSHFVDLNDLRVARTEEILEVVGDHSPQAQTAAQSLTRVLNQIYDRYDALSLVSLKRLGKRQARKSIEDLEGISRFVVDYCFLTALGGHAIPLTEKMKEYLIREGLVHPEAAEEEIHGFLERQISAADGWLFYTLLRAAAEGTRLPVGKGSAGSRGKSKKKTKSRKGKASAEK
jgi:endonuclease III